MNQLPNSILFIGLTENEHFNSADIRKCLKKRRIEFECVFQPEDTLKTILDSNEDIIFLDFELNLHKTIDILRNVHKLKPQKCVIILADEKNQSFYSKAMKAGAFDFLNKKNLDFNLLEKSVIYAFNHSKILNDLRESESKFKDLIEHLPAMFYISEIRPPYSQIYASPLFAKFGYELEEWLKVKNMWSDVLHPEDKEWVLAETDRAMECGEETNYEYRLIGKNGETFWVHDAGHFYHAADGKTVYWQGIMSDITERKMAQEQLYRKLQYDELTGLKNRHNFIENLQNSVSLLEKDQSKTFAVFLLDIDRFKLINDSLGHLTGDKFLIDTGQKLQNIVGNYGKVARLSGDEFAILIDDATDLSFIEKIAADICESLAMPVEFDDYKFSSSVSIGITIAGDCQIPISNLLRNADVAMYHAKSSGKNCFKFYDELLYEKNLRLIKLENELRNAFEKNEFSLDFQPIICLRTGKIRQVECLMRWKNSNYGEVLPTEFIPIAEENGLIIPIGEWVLEKSCQQLRKWLDSEDCDKDLILSVNISAKQLINKNFINRVNQILEDNNLQPQNLCLEITESSLMENGEYVFQAVNLLHEAGIRLSTDDFGTGYSSLSYLHKFPFDELKIDSSFIKKLENDRKSRKIVRAMINLAQSLDLAVVAEGVENQAQLEKLVEFGCDAAQGYYFSKPLPSISLDTILSDKVQLLLQNGFVKQFSTMRFESLDFSANLPS